MAKFATALVFVALAAFAMADGPYSYGRPYESYGEKKGYDASPDTYHKKDSYGYGASHDDYGYNKKPSHYEAVPYYSGKKDYYTSPYDYNKKDSYGYDAPFPVTYYKPSTGYESPSYGYSKYEKPKSYGGYSPSY
ncbi:hypothetical protein DAPPUDRAFT_300237 [Daphnia pulex]|uniref:Uncharacterized protein n=1 Tax=Daphnia pulex TaxID=6669 RepID=E9G5J9_DAPPU|nr:hypothetical protein DAPPUDRAFT_300237 [Daphnia pulex]|eukprot:EFX85617.1 hypothetical protein DAPPUDRAFT_300237 [Daphnia pulex]